MSDYGIEGLNPTRRYKWFRPRQAMTGAINSTNPQNGFISGLYNPSRTHYLVVRSVLMQASGSAGNLAGLAYVKGNPGTVGGNTSPLIPGDFPVIGQMWAQDTLTAPTPTIFLDSQADGTSFLTWGHDFPVAIISPGWSLETAPPSVVGSDTFGAVWEAILPEELEFLY